MAECANPVRDRHLSLQPECTPHQKCCTLPISQVVHNNIQYNRRAHKYYETPANDDTILIHSSDTHNWAYKRACSYNYINVADLVKRRTLRVASPQLRLGGSWNIERTQAAERCHEFCRTTRQSGLIKASCFLGIWRGEKKTHSSYPLVPLEANCRLIR